MKLQQVMLKAMSGELTWLEAADILRMSPRSLRRWRWRYQAHGYDGLLDRRTGLPSPRRAPHGEVEAVLRLYRESYLGFNVRHFHQLARKEHDLRLSYSFVKKALQEAGLVRKRRPRGRHRMRRERRRCFGEMLHIDGSPHRWLALNPEEDWSLIVIIDDATSQVLYAQLWEEETVEAIMSALKEVFETHGLPMALYSDRAGWAFHTPEAGGAVDRKKLTQVGRALKQLGVEHIPAYSPQARGRSERMNRTFQDRLVNELKSIAKAKTVEQANQYLRERYLDSHNAFFAVKPQDDESAFVRLGAVDLNQVLCHEEERVVAKDNTVRMDGVVMQIPKQLGRRTCEGLRVLVRRHLDGWHSIHWGQRELGIYSPEGELLPQPDSRAA